MPELEVIIPVYNEAPIIGETVRRAAAELSASIADWRLTIVDNASTDGSGPVAAAAGAGAPRVRVIGEPRLGKGAALKSGLLAAEATYALYMDADLSTDLKHIPDFLAVIKTSGADIVAGSRLLEPHGVNRSPLRTATSRLYNLAVRSILGTGLCDAQCGFKMMRLAAVRPLIGEIREVGWFFDTELIMLARRADLKTIELPIRWEEETFAGRRSKLSVLRDSIKVVSMLRRLKRRRD
jgi:glycosyltransferase involved in cell wall biosynthesis